MGEGPQTVRVLLVGLGGFGRNHLRAWCEMGMGDWLYVAELLEPRHAECRKFNLPTERVTTDYREFLDRVDIVDIVTPTESHFSLCREAVLAGKDVFVEKPMTMILEEAVEVADLVAGYRRVLQVGYYYRFHPISVHLKERVDAGEMGDLRYLSGQFMGFKRARTDVGVTHTDAIHFIDLFNWLVGSPPDECYAVTRDHFKRDMEDCSIVLLQYPGGVLAKVESGYVQPGRWRDKVVPGAFTTKEVFVVGTRATAEVDFEAESFVMHDIHHEFRDGTWWPVHRGSTMLNVGMAMPVEMVKLELATFLQHVQRRSLPMANAVASGVILARLIEAIYRSARENRPVALEWTTAERQSLSGVT